MTKQYNPIPFYGRTVEDAFKELQPYRNSEIITYINFNGKLLFSDKINTLDDAYKVVTGLNKVAYEAQRKAELDKLLQEIG